MSEYHAQKTQFKDGACLVDALKEQGYSEVEVHEVATQLFDWHGHTTRYLDPNGDKANIIVRRHIVGGAANDLGFKKMADGTYEAIVSQYDSHKHNAQWFKGLKKSYVEKVDHKTAAKNGLKFLGRKIVNGRVQLQFLDPRAN
ncbi:MAG: hypothetical protein C5B59_07090 [Bacteroidetes bacterium]|nr:MAG: hypothetical protein C5B59_07090 [Bacteroidota bacterium]